MNSYSLSVGAMKGYSILPERPGLARAAVEEAGEFAHAGPGDTKRPGTGALPLSRRLGRGDRFRLRRRQTPGTPSITPGQGWSRRPHRIPLHRRLPVQATIRLSHSTQQQSSEAARSWLQPHSQGPQSPWQVPPTGHDPSSGCSIFSQSSTHRTHSNM